MISLDRCRAERPWDAPDDAPVSYRSPQPFTFCQPAASDGFRPALKTDRPGHEPNFTSGSFVVILWPALAGNAGGTDDVDTQGWIMLTY